MLPQFLFLCFRCVMVFIIFSILMLCKSLEIVFICCFVILCRDSKIPAPPPGHKWKEVRHDNKVTWLVSWTENIQGSIKYIMLNPSSRIKVKV